MLSNTAKWTLFCVGLMLLSILAAGRLLAGAGAARAAPMLAGDVTWGHLSSTDGDLPTPANSTQQVLTLILDIDRDGVNDFVIGSRRAPGESLVWYRRGPNGWSRHTIEPDTLQLEAGGAFHDIDGDGDLDIVAGNNNKGKMIWWWENPHPNYTGAGWTRRVIKDSGGNKHHDMLFGQFDNDPATEFVYWNQGAKNILIVEVPADPTNQPWPAADTIHTAPSTQYEGLAQADVDGDGRSDIIGGGYWFKHTGGVNFTANRIETTPFSRVAAGQLIPGGRPEIVQVPGDDDGPGRWFEWNGSAWVGHDLPGGQIKHGHSLDLGDVNGDGHLDIFIAEMRFAVDDPHENPDARTLIFWGDSQGDFTAETIAAGFGHHESRLGDLDGDGDLDILGKSFSWETPRVDVWLNGETDTDPPGCESGGAGAPIGDWEWQRRVIDPSRPGRATFLFDFDVDGDGRADIVTGKFWYRQPANPDGAWARTQLPAPLEDVIAARDFDGDGDVDLLGTAGATLPVQQSYWAPFVWARNDGGAFTVLSNIDNTGMNQMPSNDPVQGVAVAQFTPGGPLQIAVTWDNTERPSRNPFGIQLLTVPTNPSSQTWERRKLSDVSVGEELSAVDMDTDGDLDLFMGYMWLRNNGGAGTWPSVTIFAPETGQTSRHRVVDVDGDGDLDAVIGYAHGGDDRLVTWYEQRQPDDPWQLHVIANLPRGDAESMDVVDVDGDGDPDVIVGEYNHNADVELSGTLFIYENRSDGANWTRHEVYDGDSHYQSSRVIDIDGDGDYDVAAKGWHHDDVYLYEQLDCNAPEPTPTATRGTPTPTQTPTPSATPIVTDTPTSTPTATGEPPPPGSRTYYLSSAAGGTIGGFSYADEDILQYDEATGQWALFFDGSDVGVGSPVDVDAFHLRADGTLLLSLAQNVQIAGLETVDDSDVLHFNPTSLGMNTAGTFLLYFDASDVGLTTNGEDVDALAEAADGRLILSTNGKVNVPGVVAQDRDLLAFTPTQLGADTVGAWSLYLRGSDVGLGETSEDINTVMLFDEAELYLSTVGEVQTDGGESKNTDVLFCPLLTTGQPVNCAAPLSVAWSALSQGMQKAIDALSIVVAEE